MQLNVNGVDHELDVSSESKLADVLRRELGLTGTKIGCGEGGCGSCVVLLDGRPIRSCVYPAHRAAGKRILTVEGLAASWGDPDELHPLQQAFIEHGVVQCGFCTPGMLMSAAALWNRMVASPDASPVTDDEIKRALGRNACRCTGYASVLRAVRSALQVYQTGEPLPPSGSGTMAPMQVVGRSYARPDAVEKVTGAARFADVLAFPGMLYGATLRAAHPHARILSVDASGAAARPDSGIEGVLRKAK